ncbi:hypothetical protein Q7A53_05495 [Halobacillus rhizosphaerae]|uniref:hypothetical protein n=1 Tax=Halobacillus rhizosphaerae TaxID=3064889 RepID=UPI00398B3482
MVAITKNKVDNFIKSLDLPKSLAQVLLKTEKECDSFYIGFYGRNHYVLDDLLDYRDHRIEHSSTTLVDFLHLCNENILSAFESTFFQKFTAQDIAFISGAIDKGNVTLENLYSKFHSKPSKNIMQYVL